MDSFRKLAPVLPGSQGVIYDMALRGVHHHQLLRELGWLSVNKVQAKELIKRDGDVKSWAKGLELPFTVKFVRPILGPSKHASPPSLAIHGVIEVKSSKRAK